MPPEITDALIVRAIQSRKMIAAGHDYWRQGRVGQLQVSPDGRKVQALVRGTDSAPYTVDLRFHDNSSSQVSASCSCPVGLGCKHLAATFFALQANMQMSDPKKLVGGIGGRADTKPAPLVSLPPPLAGWLTSMRQLRSEETSPLHAPGSRAIFYIVRPQPVDGKAGAGKGRKVGQVSPGRSPSRLNVEVVDALVDAAGQPTSNGAKLSPHLLYYAADLPEHLTSDDMILIRRLQARIGETDSDGCLLGCAGFELLSRVVETGRARLGTARGPLLAWGETVCGEFRWSHDELGRARLSVSVASDNLIIGLSSPPVAIEVTTGNISRIDADVSPATAEQLLRMPPVAPDLIDLLAARWDEVAPATVPAPMRPRIRELGRVAPVPVLVLMVDRVTIEDSYSSRYRFGRKIKPACAIARLSFDYGVTQVSALVEEETLLLRDGDGLVRFTRDLEAETAAEERLFATELVRLVELEEVFPTPKQLWDYAPHLPAAPEDYTYFLLNEADELRRDGWRVEVASDFPLTLVDVDASSLVMEVVPTGIDWFDLALGATVDGVEVDLVPALRALLASHSVGDLLKVLESDSGAGRLLPLALGDGRVASVDAERILPVLRALMILAANDPPTSVGTARTGFSAHDLGLLAALETSTGELRWRGAEPLRRLARQLADLRFNPTPLPAGLQCILRPYQQTGLDWLQALAQAGLGGLLADDMGLGKTVQTLAHVAVMKVRGELVLPVLIVAPTSVLPNWQAEIARFTPELSVLLLHGPDRGSRHEEVAAHDVVLTSYPLLVRDSAVLAKERFGLAVFDEAHNLKNPRTAGHAAAHALVAARKIALTGTPVENRLTDAWALFELVMPGLLGSLKAFTRDYRTPIEKQGDAAAKHRLARKLKPFLLRRTKEAVAADLPEKSLVPLRITLGTAQMALHESQRLLMHTRVQDEIARVGLMRAQIIILTALTRLRQICCDPRLIGGRDGKLVASAKLERLLELLEELIPEGRRIILFSQFTSMLDLIKPELDRREIGWTELTGRTKDRKAPVERFQAGEVPLILVSLKAGGTGLNLTAADTVLLYDPWWNPAIEAQAIDRAHRIGQTRRVFVHRMIAEGTIEEKILALQARKAALAETLWSEDPATPAQLSEEDIAFLLG